jgi:hypothetical protein
MELRVITPAVGLRFGIANSIGTSASTHVAPCSADAAKPQTTPRRRDHKQAAAIRS